MLNEASSFLSQGHTCAGSLLRPAGAQNCPVIIMAHGFAAIRQARLPAFAERFVSAGYAVYLFDYRHFGDSEGEPRHLVSPRRQQQDWRAAIAHVQQLAGIDVNNIVLWGTSFSGGHVLHLAAQGLPVRAVISQVPHVDGLKTLGLIPFRQILRLTMAGLRDVLGQMIGHPYYSPVVGHPGDLAAMSSPEAFAGYLAMLPDDANWENRVAARIFLGVSLYSPGRHAEHIQVPTLVIAGRHDTVTPANAARQVAARIPQGEFRMLESNHFEPYFGSVFMQNIAIQLEFLQRHVPTTAAQGG